MIWILLAAMWTACGTVAYGITFAYFQRKFACIADEGRMEDMGMAICYGLMGPIGLLASFFLSGFAQYGLKFK